jgi:hypothetical protein
LTGFALRLVCGGAFSFLKWAAPRKKENFSGKKDE